LILKEETHTVTTKITRDLIQVVTPEEEGAETSLILGAYVSLQTLYESPDIPDLLHRSLNGALNWQARNEHTGIKVVLSPNLAPQFVAALLAWGARALFGDEEGELADYLNRTLTHDNHFSGIRLPVHVPGRVWGESHVARTPADEPIVTAIAVVDLIEDPDEGSHSVVRQARLALTGAWREHARLAESAKLLVGKTLSDDTIRQVTAAVEQEVSPRDDFLGSTEYRRSMAAVLTQRALEYCKKGANRQ
jgi:CO/xanthine dehydrogenase FAD-binding subunit